MCVCVCVHVCVRLLSHVQLYVTPWTVALQAPLPMEFSRQEYWSGLSFPNLGDLPDPGIKPTSLVSPALAGRFFTTVHLGIPRIIPTSDNNEGKPPNSSASQVVLVVKNLPANAGDTRDMGSIPGSARSFGEGNGYPLQYSCLENFVDRGAWWAKVHGVTKSWTHLSD